MSANFVLTRDAGDNLPTLVPFEKKFGLKMGCFVEMPVEVGIARLTAMGEVEAPTNIPAAEQYYKWAHLTLEALDDYEFLYVHLIGPDGPAHDEDHAAKLAP